MKVNVAGAVLGTATVCVAVGVGFVVYSTRKYQAHLEQEERSRRLTETPVGDWVETSLMDDKEVERTFKYRQNSDPTQKRFTFAVGKTEIEFEQLDEGLQWVRGLPQRNWRNRKPKEDLV